MARGAPKYYVRRVRYIREEYQIVDAGGNQKAWVDPDKEQGSYFKRTPSPEEMEVLEGLRILTEAEAGILGLPFEGERVTATVAAPDRDSVR